MDSSGSKGDMDAPSHSTRPYLVRAIYQWALDNSLTPQILVNTDHAEVRVPVAYVRDQRIVLNIHPQSVESLELGNEYLMFSARFSGKRHELIVPVDSILAVYAREDGQGIVFQESGTGDESTGNGSTGDPQGKPGPDKPATPTLKLVK